MHVDTEANDIRITDDPQPWDVLRITAGHGDCIVERTVEHRSEARQVKREHVTINGNHLHATPDGGLAWVPEHVTSVRPPKA